MKQIGIKYLILLLLFPGAGPVLAQVEEFIDDEGEVVEGEFLISKEREITLPAAQRIFQKVAPDEKNKAETEPLTYEFKKYTPQIKDIRTHLRVLKLKEDKVVASPASYLNLGYGNFVTPYVEVGLNSGINKAGSYGLNAYHLSSNKGPVDEENSGDSHSRFSLFGKRVGSSASIGGSIGYQRDGYHFYGYEEGIEVSRDTIKQIFNDINLNFDIRSSDTELPLQYLIYGKVYNISDNYDASEFGTNVGLAGDYKISDPIKAKLGLDYLFAGYKNPETINRSFFRLYPAVVYSNFGLTIDVGMKIVNHNDTLGDSGSTRIFPSIYADYQFTDNIAAYAAVDGDVETLTFRDITRENPYVNSNLPINHTDKNLDILLGLKGSILQYLAFDVGIRSVTYKNMYFYVNDPLEFNKFQLIYDKGNTQLFQGLISLSYFKSKIWGGTLSTRFNSWSTDEVEKAWHKPNLELDLSVWYNLYDKVKFSADFFVLSGIEAPDLRVGPESTTTLESAADLNLKVDYILSEKYSVFIGVNNLLNNNYQLLNMYPTRGLLVLGGLSLSF